MDDLNYQKLVRDAALILAVFSINLIEDFYGINRPPPPICAEQYKKEWNERHPLFQLTPPETPEYPESFLENLSPRYRRMLEATNKSRNEANRVNKQRAHLEPNAYRSDTRSVPDTTSSGLVYYIDFD